MRTAALALLAALLGAGLLAGRASLRTARPALDRPGPATGPEAPVLEPVSAELATPPEVVTDGVRAALAPGKGRGGGTGSLASVAVRAVTSDGVPLSFATVVLRHGAREVERARLDPAGRAHFTGLVAGRYSLELEGSDLPPGFTRAPCVLSGSARVPFELGRGDDAEVALRALASATLRGVAVDAEGAPIAGAAVRLQDASADEILDSSSTTTDESGSFALADLVPGRYRIQVSWSEAAARGAPPAPWIEELAPGSERALVLHGEPDPATVRGSLVGEDGLPLADVVVQCEQTDGLAEPSGRERPAPWSRVLARTRTDANGAYELTGLPRESVVVRAAPRRGSRPALGSRPVLFEEAVTGRLDLRAAHDSFDCGVTSLRPRSR